MEILLTGKPISAERAKEIGLVWRLVEPDALSAGGTRVGADAHRGSPLAQRATKEIASRTATMGWIESVRFGETMRKVAGATDDVAEGFRRSGRSGGRPGRPAERRGMPALWLILHKRTLVLYRVEKARR